MLWRQSRPPTGRLQFRGDLVLRPKAEDREVVDEVIARGRPVRQNGVIGRLHRALELPLGIQVAVQAVVVALVVQLAGAARRRLQRQRRAADVVAVMMTERGDRQFLEMRAAGLRSALLTAGVDQRRHLADPLGAVRAELLVVVGAGTVLAQARAEWTVLRVTETGARRADAGLVAGLKRRERHVRLECREISGSCPRLVRL